MSSGKVIGSIFLARDELLRMEELPVNPCPDLVDNRRFKINKYSSRHMFAGLCLAEEGAESIMPTINGGVTATNLRNPLVYHVKQIK